MATAVETAHAYEPHRCTAADLFTFNGDDAGSEKAAAFIHEVDEYLSTFAAPVRNADGTPVCFHCGEKIDSFMQACGLAVAYRWGIAHGEAECSGCGWPARGMHYPKGADGEELFSLRNFFLAYHPDVVEADAPGGEA